MPFPNSVMHETVMVYSKTGNSAYGPVFGAGATETCYLEPGFKRVTNSRGEEVVSSLWGVFRAECSIAVGDEITWGGRRYKAIDVMPMRKGGGVHHVEVYFGSVGSA